MKCPLCETELVWQADHEDCEGRSYGHYICLECGQAEVFAYFEPVFNAE